MSRQYRSTVVCVVVCLLGSPWLIRAEEVGKANMEVRIYPSTLNPDLKLSAEFYVPAEPKPLCLFFHGWHMTAAGSARAGYMEKLARRHFVVNVDMRGRGRSTGTPDASGHELMDALDALDFARRTWPDLVNDAAGVYVVGGSGGGGNTMALVGKAPDVFASAVAWAGMSDYALWYEDDTTGRYRDEMESKGWIGGSPDANPEGYRSRGGLHVLDNVLTSLLVFHGRKDNAVPVHHAEAYRDRAAKLDKTNVRVHLNDAGHESIEWPLALEFLRQHVTPPRLPRTGTLLVHSFLACKSFWLVLDDPARMGTVEYELDDSGRLKSARFHQAEGNTPPKDVLLRVPGPAKALWIMMGEQTLTLDPVDAPDGRSDFRWECAVPWTATVVW